ncbi:uncharacterized protein LDX57_002867 [Aspergillus melleus]|uniref:uncharacterized protein n=1 Tax=Aspergillus melleus TaxID=138277 RepID=UPI001E8E03EF|nr:uncharacterized protein LDX57_002867 [Aspergillus melleus]KAH8425118.1 hypothetical protein LDX57_002867 [Aspergillus melleus]
MQQISLSEALQPSLSASQECTVPLSPDICFGAVAMGGYMPALAAKYAVYYASQHPRLKSQASLRTMNAQFYRPLLPARGPARMVLREISVGKAWSTLRVEVFQPAKCQEMAVSADMLLSDQSISSLTRPTNWTLHPPPRSVDLAKLETYSDPGWICYHTAFKPTGFKRAHSYVKHFIPVDWRPATPFIEQWITPGWNCTPSGSATEDRHDGKAGKDTCPRWTTDMIPLIMDASLPPECNFLSQKDDQQEHIASMASFLRYATAQKSARERGDPNWRDLPNDGSGRFDGSMLNVTLAISTDIRQELPEEGVRWLYLRDEVKSIRNGGINVETLLFNQGMELVAVSHQIGQFVSSEKKRIKEESRL